MSEDRERVAIALYAYARNRPHEREWPIDASEFKKNWWRSYADYAMGATKGEDVWAKYRPRRDE